MSSSLLEKTIQAFEERMALRRRMLRLAGVALPGRNIPESIEEEIRESIFKCNDCGSGTECAAWLAAAKPGTPPAAFCPNRDAILRLKAEGYAAEGAQ
jgi:hypothetical protein